MREDVKRGERAGGEGGSKWISRLTRTENAFLSW